MIFKTKIGLAAFLCFLTALVYGQESVTVDLSTKHSVGSSSTFDRSKFMVAHAEQTENDWFTGKNFTEDVLEDFIIGKDLYIGRDTGRISYFLRDVIKEDPKRKGFPDVAHMANRGADLKKRYTNNPRNPKDYHNRQNLIIAGQVHPFYPDGKKTNTGWALSQEGPFGEATGEYFAYFYKEFFGEGGQNPPLWIEVINEPLFVLFNDVAPAERQPIRELMTDLSEYHVNVAKKIKSVNPDSDVKVGGYTVAFPNFEEDNFNRWLDRDKLFMDLAGDEMDFWSIHLYDFTSFPSRKGPLRRIRSGSNVEATFDMMEGYSKFKFNEIKPFVVSEYGGVAHTFIGKTWSREKDWLLVKAYSSLLMSFLERPDLIASAIPFALAKASFCNCNTYNLRLLRQEKEAGGTSETWVYTDLVKFFDLWKNVKGTRVDTKSTNPDIRVDAYVDGNKAHVIVNNLTFEKQEIKTSLLNTDRKITSLNLKHLYNGGIGTELDDVSLPINTSSVSLGAEGTLILEYTFDDAISIDNNIDETKYYADYNLQSIAANTNYEFAINNVKTTTDGGEAVLRLGIGRNHGKSLKPKVTINGTQVSIPENYRGYDQFDNGKGRATFFGVIEIPIAYDLLQENNTVSFNFPDSQGHISSVSMQVFNKELEIEELPPRTRSITFDNRDTFILPGATNPEIEIGQVLDITLSYSTAIADNVEEDLNYIATLVRHVDENNVTLASSAFTTSVENAAPNSGTASYSYTVPKKFTDDTPIPTSENLPSGHKLLLVIFMSVDGDTGFANATETITLNKENTLSIDDFVNNENNKRLSHYPNPADKLVNIEGEFDSWKLYSISGITIKEGNSKVIDVEALPVGLYYLQFKNSTVLKLLKK